MGPALGGVPLSCWGGKHVNKQLQHNVISVLSCFGAKCTAAKAGPLEVAAVGRE